MVEKKLIDFLKNNFGYITTKEIEQLGISKISIPELVSHGLIRKVARGIYIDSKLIEDEFYIKVLPLKKEHMMVYAIRQKKCLKIIKALLNMAIFFL